MGVFFKLLRGTSRTAKVRLVAGGALLRRVHPESRTVGSEDEGGAALLVLFEKWAAGQEVARRFKRNEILESIGRPTFGCDGNDGEVNT